MTTVVSKRDNAHEKAGRRELLVNFFVEHASYACGDNVIVAEAFAQTCIDDLAKYSFDKLVSVTSSVLECDPPEYMLTCTLASGIPVRLTTVRIDDPSSQNAPFDASSRDESW